MHTFQKRFGKATIRIVLAGAAAVAGGVATVPSMLSEKKSSAPTTASVNPPTESSAPATASVNPSTESSSQAWRPVPGTGTFTSPNGNEQNTLSSQKVVDSPRIPLSAELSGGDNFVQDSKNTAVPRPSKKKEATSTLITTDSIESIEEPNSVRVYYATDRFLYSATDPQLWVTTLAPAVFVVLITALLVAGTFAGRKRVWWGLATLLGLGLSYLIVGNTIIKTGTLYRLAQDDSLWFSSRRMSESQKYPLNLGSSLVSIPPRHVQGEIEEPSPVYFEFKEDENKHIMIQRIDALDVDTFYSQVNQRVSQDSEKSILIFVHGYNVGFDSALRRTAQLSVDLKFGGAPVLFSWPSHGRLAWYRSDQEEADWSAPHLEQFLADLRQRTGVKKIHVIAHSMGNRALVGALERLGLRYPYQQPMLEQVVMAAPDVGVEDFKKRFASKVKQCAARTTVYASANDRALLASAHVNNEQRLGLTMSTQATIDGIDFVDVTPIDMSLLGHSYFGNHPLMIQELRFILRQNVGPERRDWLIPKDAQYQPPVWKFSPQFAGELPFAR
jgi:esterase/lipase superfamily enzyme